MALAVCRCACLYADSERCSACLQLREIAPEFYNNLHCHMSWSKVVYDYITNPNVGPFSRTKRMPETRFANAGKAD